MKRSDIEKEMQSLRNLTKISNDMKLKLFGPYSLGPKWDGHFGSKELIADVGVIYERFRTVKDNYKTLTAHARQYSNKYDTPF